MLTYDQIVNIEFPKVTFGGYKSDNVEDYIEDVASTVKALLEQIKSLNDKIESLNNEISEYKKTESSLHAALVIAQETGQKLVQDASQKADELIKEAEDKAATITNQAQDNAERTVIDANTNSAELMKKTKERASEILREALSKANSITQKAKENCINEEAKYEDLKRKVKDFRSTMLILYRNHVELLNEMRPEPEVSDVAENKKTSTHTEDLHTVQEPEISEEIEQESAVSQEVVEADDLVCEPDDTVEINDSDDTEEAMEDIIDEAVEDLSEEIDDEKPFESNDDVEEQNSGFQIEVINDFNIPNEDENFDDIEEIDLSKISFSDFSDSDESNTQLDFEFLNK